jgi:CDP-6-deoxy-D-xylo-4-hexulose-3-dehydrase
MACFNDKKKYERAKLLRGWGRSSAIFNESEGLKLRFSEKVDGIPYDGKYIFSELGFNFLPSEISAAFALEQLKKLKKNIKIRIKNFERIYKFFKSYPNYFDLPTQIAGVKTGWLAYPIIIKKNSKIERREMQIFLEKKGIQTRTIFTGNILRQPVMKNRIHKKIKNAGVNSDNVMRNGILIGCHHGLNAKDLTYIKSKFNKFLTSFNII